MFLHQCITLEALCTRCICPQNEINEITGVPERAPVVIKPGGRDRLDELIDRSAEEEAAAAAAAGGILMQDKCQRCDMCVLVLLSEGDLDALTA